MQTPVDIDPIATSHSVPLPVRPMCPSGVGDTEGKGRVVNIVIYTKSQCPNCVTAKALLKSKGLVYDEFDAENIHIRADIEHNHPHIRQMPAIWVNGQYVGGLVGIQAALKQMGL